MTIINVNSISGINSITAQGASGIEFYDSSGVNQRFNITSAGLIDISGGVQVSENITPTSGAGLELFREGGGGGQVQAFDRSGSAWLPLILKGSTQSFYTSGTERLRITSGGDLNIGSSFNTSSSSGFGIGHTITNVANNRTGCIKLQADGYNNAYYNVLEVYNGSSLTCNIKADGNIVLASGSGIDFSASAGSGISAGGGVLDDYEEGSWTPTGTSDLSSVSNAHYIKVGRLVTITCRLNFGSNSSSTRADIGGLPFTPDQNLSNSAMGSAVGETTYTGADRPFAGIEIGGLIRFRINGGTSMAYTDWSSHSVRLSVTYFSNS